MTRFAELDLGDEKLIVVWMADLNFATPRYVHDGLGELRFGGNTYLGIGELGSIEPFVESTSTIPAELRLTLTGVDPALLSLVETEDYRGNSVTLRFGVLNEDYTFKTGWPKIRWEGRMSHTEDEIGKTGSITLLCKHRFEKAQVVRRYTDQDQQQEFPGDRCFEFMHELDRVAQWGGGRVLPGTPPRGGPGEILP